MDAMQAIWERRSIRKFADRPLARELIETVLEAAIRAPSGKNAQPWRFVVLQGKEKDRLVDILEAGVNALQAKGLATGSALPTAHIMRQAPVAILVYNPRQQAGGDRNGTNRYMHLVDTQSIGAAVQNLLLAATGLGLGSLWICDVFYADDAIGARWGRQDELVCAVSLGYPAETPQARPRKPVADITTWLE
ncbi:MAG TPA: nitroreductase [Clostridiales bacterium UBA8153]|nr:nitroreductase [Clostridiales bacterium UBA8153]